MQAESNDKDGVRRANSVVRLGAMTILLANYSGSRSNVAIRNNLIKAYVSCKEDDSCGNEKYGYNML